MRASATVFGVLAMAAMSLTGALASGGTGSSADGEHHSHRVHKPIAQPQFSLVPPYHAGASHIPFWQLHGDARVTADGVSLTMRGVPSAAGAVWATHPSHMHAWVVDLEFRATGASTAGTEGLGLFYTRDRHFGGMLFGSHERFSGAAILFDSEDSDRKGDNPSVTVVVSDGNPDAPPPYHARSDGLESKNARRCQVDYRNHDRVIARAVYKYHTLTVLVDVTGTAHSFIECATIEGIDLGTGGHFGVSAATSDTGADEHTVLAFRTASLSAKHAPKVDYEHEIAVAGAGVGASGSGAGSGSGSDDFVIPSLGDIFDDDRYDDDFFTDDIADDEDWEWDDDDVDAHAAAAEDAAAAAADGVPGGGHPDEDLVGDGKHEGPEDTTAHKMGFRKFDEVDHDELVSRGHGAESGAAAAKAPRAGAGSAFSTDDADRIKHLVNNVDRLARYLDNMETSIEASLENVYSTVVDLRHEVRSQMESMHTKVDENSAVAELHAVVKESTSAADGADGGNGGNGAAGGALGGVVPADIVTRAELHSQLAPIKKQIELVASTLALLSEHTQVLADHTVEQAKIGGAAGTKGSGLSRTELDAALHAKFSEHASRQDNHDKKLKKIQNEISTSWYFVIGFILLFQIVFLVGLSYYRKWRTEEKKWV